MKRCEVLSPVGSMEAFYAAINSNCDAIYLAGEMYGARKSTQKFNIDDISFIINEAHKYNVKVYITINTLIFDNEIDEVIKYTDIIYKLGVDAVLIQDMGLLNIFTKRYKDLDIHISTQANTKTLEEIKFYELEKNVKRVVLARETPISEIERIKKNTNLEVEVFVHGAICMSYSGACLYSSLAFNRSGNRGECAQPCRLKYSLIENNKVIDDSKYLLSPKELNTIDYIDKLLEIGVDSLKIEGRIKSPEYVAVTTSLYKEKVLNPKKLITDIEKDLLKRAYNRDFTKGYLFDITPSSLVNNFRPNNMGIYLGKIIESNNKYLKIKLESKLNRLDGIRIITLKDDDYGLIVDNIYLNEKSVESANKSDIVTISSFKLPKFDCKNFDVYVTSSIELKNVYKDKLKLKIDRHNIGLDLYIEFKIGKSPILKELNKNITVSTDFIIEKSNSITLNQDTIYNQLNKLVDTPYYIGSIKYDTDLDSFIPLGVINALRRNLIEELYKENIKERKIIDNITFNNPDITFNKTLIVKVETLEQFNKAYEMGIRDFIVLGLELYNKVKSIYNSDRVYLEAPRIIDDYSLYNNAKSIVTNEVSLVNKLNNPIIDSYLNCTNIYALNYYYNRGAKLITLSKELTKDLILDIKNKYNKVFKSNVPLALTIYDRSDLMIMKYCLIAGHYKTKPNCNICLNKTYYLKDRNDNLMPIIKTPTCGNRLLNSKTLCLFEYLNVLKDYIDVLRINFTTENKDEVEKVLKAYFDNRFIDGLDFTRERFLK